MKLPLVIIVIFFVMRLFTLTFSIKNENRLKKEGAVEYGKINSIFMTVLHVLFYLASFSEAIIRHTVADRMTVAGISLFLFGYMILLYVMYQLRDIWTVKLYIAKKHEINTSFLFKYVRHPNYFLNIIPELVGIGLICKAWYSMMSLLPLYAIVMTVRIIQEEGVMKRELPYLNDHEKKR